LFARAVARIGITSSFNCNAVARARSMHSIVYTDSLFARSNTMNRQLITAIAFLAGLGFAGTAFAQGRWDERPHGYNAQLAKAKKSAVETPSAVGGRHDEKPHAMTKRVEPKEVEAKPEPAAPVVAPVAASSPKSPGL
jgi:hypothetical protein